MEATHASDLPRLSPARPGATPWVFLRGLAREARHWGAFADAWRRVRPDDPVLLLDLPGAGVRHQERAPATMAGIVELVRRDARQRLGVAEGAPLRVRLVGLSLGGMVAVEWMRGHPDEVDLAVLISSSAAGSSAPWQRLRPAALATSLRIVASRGVLRERLVLRMTSNRPERFDEWAAEYATYAETHPVSAGNAARQMVAAARYRPPRFQPTCPVLVLVGDGDRMVSPACSRALAKALGSELRAHPTAGHDLPLDEPDWVAQAIGDFAAATRPNEKSKTP